MMSKSSTKRRIPKISKWGKFFKLGRSKKKEKKPICEEEMFAHDELSSKTNKDQEPTTLLVESTTETNVQESREEDRNLEEQTETEDCSLKEKKDAVKVDLCQKFEQEEKISNGGLSHVLEDRKTESKNTEEENEHEVQQRNDTDMESADKDNSLPKENSSGFGQVSHVVVHSPYPTKPEETHTKINTDEKDEQLALPILSTPSPKIKRSDVKTQKDFSVKIEKDFDEDSVFLAAPVSTPSQKKPENRESRILTVKKIRSIISTPYKRLKREGSLLDGQTYRYIEIQSLVNAIESMHPCIGSMIACNEKGLQYGKSSVLRIECKECNAKVFLQASRN